MSRPIRQLFATCHPDQPYHCKGLCKKCYRRQHAREYYHSSEKCRQRMQDYNKTPGQQEHRRLYSQQFARRDQLKHRYNITPEQYDQLNAQQHGLCAVCHQPPKPKHKLVIDHNHVTHTVRGLVHRYCNMALGFFENPIWHAQADTYLALNTPHE